MDNKNLKVLSFILARAGSTGVPGKNIKLINGKPLLGYTLEISKASKYINRTIVATDGEDISKIAKEFGADVPFLRPDEISGKYSVAHDVYKYYLKRLEEEEGYRPDIFVCLFSTSYSKTVEEVDASIKKLIETKCDWVFTVGECEHHPHRNFIPLDGDRMINFCKDIKSYEILANRQELPPVYRINGNAFVTWTENIEKYDTYNMGQLEYPDSDIRYILCPQENSMDIDTPTDFEIADFILTKRSQKES